MVAEMGLETGGSRVPDAAPGIDWDAVREAYEGRDGTIEEIAARFGTTRGALAWRATSRHWRSRNRRAAVTGGTLLGRLYRLLDRQILLLEGSRNEMSEKEAAALGRVAGTLEKLMQIERAATTTKGPKAVSKDLQYLRKKIAERIDELDRSKP